MYKIYCRNAWCRYFGYTVAHRRDRRGVTVCDRCRSPCSLKCKHCRVFKFVCKERMHQHRHYEKHGRWTYETE